MRYIILTIIILISLSIVLHAHEGSLLYCNSESYSVFYSSVTNKLYLGCGGYQNDLYLITIDPSTLVQESSFQIAGGLQQVLPISNGAALLILIDTKGESVDNGALMILNPNNGQILDQVILNKVAEACCIDPSESYAYVVSGLLEPGELSKISLNNMELILSTEYAKLSNQIIITPDGSKVYANNQKRFITNNDAGFCYKLAVFNTSNLTQIKTIDHMHMDPILTMGSNGYLYFSGGFRWEEDTPNFYIFDTNNNDQVIYSRNFGETCLDFISLDPSETHIYLTNSRKTLYDPEYPGLMYESSNIVIEINLSDYSTRDITFSDGHLDTIAVAEVNCDNRIFCSSFEGPLFYYKDAIVRTNQNPNCSLIILTPMPYCGSSPAFVEFLANATDPDNDPLTYHWDFNGDGIYDDPILDSYTGDPWNPTHAFTDSGVHEVFLKVTDSCDGECISIVAVTIELV